MRLINLSILAIFIVPFLFVMGTIASEAATLGPIAVGSSQIELSSIGRVGESLRALTEPLAIKEINLIRSIIKGPKMHKTIGIDENLQRIRALAAKNV